MELDDTPARPGDGEPLPSGRRFARYEIVAPLGHGGMGEVHEAHDPVLRRKVAIKRIRSGRVGEAARARLLREAQALAALAHENVVVVHDAGEVDGEVFLAMELVDGVTLDEWLKTPRRPRAILDALRAAGRGLAAAHARASCIATSSHRTSSSGATAGCGSPTSGSPAPTATRPLRRRMLTSRRPARSPRPAP
jgi:serine/threonine protein kinase